MAIRFSVARMPSAVCLGSEPRVINQGCLSSDTSQVSRTSVPSATGLNRIADAPADQTAKAGRLPGDAAVLLELDDGVHRLVRNEQGLDRIAVARQTPGFSRGGERVKCTLCRPLLIEWFTESEPSKVECFSASASSAKILSGVALMTRSTLTVLPSTDQPQRRAVLMRLAGRLQSWRSFVNHVVMDVVKEVLLPGVGLRYEFTSKKGERIGIVARRSGDFDVVLYSVKDPDEARPVFRLTEEEAEAVAQILGAPRIAERFSELTREVPGLEAGQVHITPDSPFVDRALGDTRARTRTGASIVAIVRNEDVIASPGPAETLRPRDVLIVIGTEEGIAGVEHIVRGPVRSPDETG